MDHQLTHVAALIAHSPELKEAIKKAAIAGIEDYFSGDSEHCDICDVALNNMERAELDIDPNHFNRTCWNHREYRNVFQPDVIRKKLGYAVRSKSIQQLIAAL